MSEPTKRLKYAQELYAHFDANSHEKVIDGRIVKVWVGAITTTVQTLGIPMGEYPRVMKLLRTTECLRVEQRGTRGVPTILVLLRPPTGADEIVADRLTRPDSPARLTRRIEQIERTLGGINLSEILQELDTRLKKLERVTRLIEKEDNAKNT